jgi:inhibitor of KinA sporulation pathway (predicted exonuclease)
MTIDQRLAEDVRFLSIDLELERPNTEDNAKDSLATKATIIQVGISVFQIANPEPIFLENHCLTLHYPHKLSAFIEKLTKIKSEEVNASTLTIEDANRILRELREKHNTSRIMVQWGHGDFEELKKYDINNDLEVFGRSAYNTKHLFQLYATMNNIKKVGGLSKCMGRLGIQFNGNIDGKQLNKHNALGDAVNTVHIFNKLLLLIKKP